MRQNIASSRVPTALAKKPIPGLVVAFAVALGLLYNKINSQSDLPHGMRHPLERQAPLAARRSCPVRKQTWFAEVEVGAARRGTRVPHAPDRTRLAVAARRPHVHIRILIKHLHCDALARGRRLEHSWRRDDYSG